MLNCIFGEYIRSKFGGNIVTMTWQETLLADQIGSLSLVDAENGANLLSKSNSGDFFLIDYYAYADPGFVKLDVVPDADNTRRVRLDAHKHSVRTPFMIPILAEVDVTLDYTNQSIVNDLYVNITTIHLSKTKAAEFMQFSEDLVDAFFAMSSVIQSSAIGTTTPTMYSTASARGRDRCHR